MKTILFVGSNPSNASTCDAAFHGSTKSSKILTEWCKDIVGIKVHINVLDKKTENNRPLKKSEITSNLEELSQKLKAIKADKIIALGKTASHALEMLKVDFLAMPHPSGCNRQLNDKEFVAERVRDMLNYVS